MRSPSCFAGSRSELDVTMTPMIDVVFLLLIFFVWTASFRVMEYELSGDLSPPSTQGESTTVDPEKIDYEQIIVQVRPGDSGPIWQVNETEIATHLQLRGLLDSIARIKNDLPVIVDPSDKAPLGMVIEVYDTAIAAGFDTIQFAAGR